jgi:hypothetical protein
MAGFAVTMTVTSLTASRRAVRGDQDAPNFGPPPSCRVVCVLALRTDHRNDLAE